MIIERKAEFHLGIDYAGAVMLEGQTTENALVRLYGTSQEVTYYGKMIAKAINKAAKIED